jgi:hypothetical protein
VYLYSIYIYIYFFYDKTRLKTVQVIYFPRNIFQKNYWEKPPELLLQGEGKWGTGGSGEDGKREERRERKEREEGRWLWGKAARP